MSVEVLCAPTLRSLNDSAAALFEAAALAAVRSNGSFRVALAGGTTPKAVYSLLADAPKSQVPWAKIDFFWGDERHVSPNHPDSNFRMARESMLDRLSIDPGHVWRIKGEYPRAEDAAREYEDQLRSAFGLGPAQTPRFDLVLLGLGLDGHTASLFPGTTALAERRRLAVANHVAKLDTDRITLTVPVLNAARHVLFLVHGADKAAALRETLEGQYSPDEVPAQSIRLDDGRLTWLVDPSAAGLLRSTKTTELPS